MIIVEVTSHFKKSYRKLSNLIRRAAQGKEVVFRGSPFHPSLDTHKLHGKDAEMWAFSVNRRYRIKFLFLSDTRVLFLDIGLHDIYE